MSETAQPKEENSEEDFIIEYLIIEGGRTYEDPDVLPIRQSLYAIERLSPPHDKDICDFVTWCRPYDIYELLHERESIQYTSSARHLG
jgi:hypothetical protein